MKSRLVSEVIRGLTEAKGEWQSIADEAQVSYFTISKMVSGDVANPTATRIERIYLSLVRRGYLSSTFEFKRSA